MAREWKSFEGRAEALPADYRAARGQITVNLFPYTDFTGRNLMPILDGALGLLEETAAGSQSIHEVMGDDVKGYTDFAQHGPHVSVTPAIPRYLFRRS